MEDEVPSAPARHSLRFLGDTVLYGASRAGNQVAAIASVAVFSRALGPADFGALTLMLALSAFLVSVVSSAFASAVFPLYYGRAPQRRRDLLATLHTLAGGTAAVVCAFAGAAAAPLAALVFGRADYATATRFFLLQVVALAAAQVPLQLLRLQERTGAYAAWSLALGVVPVAAGAVAVAGHAGLEGLVLAQAVAALTVLAGLVHASGARLALRLDRGLAAEIVRFGAPFVPTVATNWIILSADRFLLARLFGLAAAGQYATATTVARLLEFGIQSVNMAWVPRFFAHAGENGFAARARAPVTVLTLGVLGGWALLSATAPEMLRLLFPDPPPTLAIVTAVVAWGGVSMVGYYLWVNVLYRDGRTVVAARNMIAAASVALLLNVLLIPPLGMVGAAISSVVSALVLSALSAGAAWGTTLIRMDGIALAAGSAGVVVPFALLYLFCREPPLMPRLAAGTIGLGLLASVAIARRLLTRGGPGANARQ